MNNRSANNWLLSTLGLFFYTTGASLWETVVFTPAWTKSAPGSLYILDLMSPKIFWGVVHSVFEICFLFTLIINWRLKERKFWLLGIFAGYAVLRIWTLTYFAPTYVHFEYMAHHSADRIVGDQANLWRLLNYIRTGLLILVNAVFLLFVQKTLRKVEV